VRFHSSPIPYQKRNSTTSATDTGRKPPIAACTRRGRSLAGEISEPGGRLGEPVASSNQESRTGDLVARKNIQQKITVLDVAAHDLRHPVGAILTYGALLAEGIDPTANPELVEMVDGIRSMGEFMLRLIDETLDLASIESGAIQIRTQPGTIANIVRQSVSANLPRAARKGMRLRLVEEGNARPVLMDSMRLRQVFNNLFDNAIKYCQPGAEIEAKIWRRYNEVVVSVSDNGPGIGPEDLKTLFTPFQKTRARSLSEEPGTGLGLAIAKRIVELHGGRITAQSAVGHGTTFQVSLPAGHLLNKS